MNLNTGVNNALDNLTSGLNDAGTGIGDNLNNLGNTVGNTVNLNSGLGSDNLVNTASNIADFSKQVGDAAKNTKQGIDAVKGLF